MKKHQNRENESLDRTSTERNKNVNNTEKTFRKQEIEDDPGKKWDQNFVPA